MQQSGPSKNQQIACNHPHHKPPKKESLWWSPPSTRYTHITNTSSFSLYEASFRDMQSNMHLKSPPDDFEVPPKGTPISTTHCRRTAECKIKAACLAACLGNVSEGPNTQPKMHLKSPHMIQDASKEDLKVIETYYTLLESPRMQRDRCMFGCIFD